MEYAVDDRPITKLWRMARIFYHWRIRKSTVLPYLPTEVGIEPTNRCNFTCSFCPQSQPTHFDVVPATMLVPEKIDVLLKRMREAGLRTGIIHWTLDGEPFMNKRFHELIQKAVGYGFHTHHFASNGFFLTLKRLHELPKKAQRYFITPDFCSDEAYFEEHRGKPGSWKIIRENIRLALEDPGLEHIHFQMTDISSFVIHDPSELDRRFEALTSLFPTSDRISFHRRVFHNATGHLPIADEKKQAAHSYHLCPYPWFSFETASNGDVVACCRDLDHKTVLGNLFQQSLDEIWNGERYQALRRDLIAERPEKQAACQGCDMPYDGAKASVGHLVKSAVHRMLIFERSGS